jgi:hypothetical protein
MNGFNVVNPINLRSILTFHKKLRWFSRSLTKENCINLQLLAFSVKFLFDPCISLPE